MNRATLSRFWIGASRIGGNGSRLLNRGHSRINPHKQKDRLAAVSSKSSPIFLIDQPTAAAFRFLLHPSRPSAPRPPAKSGSAPGSGVAIGAAAILTTISSKSLSGPAPPSSNKA